MKFPLFENEKMTSLCWSAILSTGTREKLAST